MELGSQIALLMLRLSSRRCVWCSCMYWSAKIVVNHRITALPHPKGSSISADDFFHEVMPGPAEAQIKLGLDIHKKGNDKEHGVASDETDLDSDQGATGELAVVSALLGQGGSVDLSDAARCDRLLLEPVKHHADGLLEGSLHSMPAELEGMGGSRGVQCLQSRCEIPDT